LRSCCFGYRQRATRWFSDLAFLPRRTVYSALVRLSLSSFLSQVYPVVFAYVGPLFCLVASVSRFLDSVFAYVGPLFWSRSIGELPFGETLVWALWTFVGVLDSVFAFVRPSSWGPWPYFSHPPTLRNRTTQPPASAQGVALEPSEAGRFQR